MKLQHHLGGLEGLDPITPEKRVFVEPWEKTIFAIHTAMMGLSNHLGFKDVPTTFKDEWTWADLRKGAEAMPPFDYFRFRYYEKWLGGISGWFVAQGYVTADELEAKTKEYLADPMTAKPSGGDAKIDAQVRHYLETGDLPKRDVGGARQVQGRRCGGRPGRAAQRAHPPARPSARQARRDRDRL